MLPSKRRDSATVVVALVVVIVRDKYNAGQEYDSNNCISELFVGLMASLV